MCVRIYYMSKYMCVCVYTCIYICVCTGVYMHVYIYMYVGICVCVCVLMCICKCMCVCVLCSCTCIYICTYTCIRCSEVLHPLLDSPSRLFDLQTSPTPTAANNSHTLYCFPFRLPSTSSIYRRHTPPLPPTTHTLFSVCTYTHTNIYIYNKYRFPFLPPCTSPTSRRHSPTPSSTGGTSCMASRVWRCLCVVMRE